MATVIDLDVERSTRRHPSVAGLRTMPATPSTWSSVVDAGAQALAVQMERDFLYGPEAEERAFEAGAPILTLVD